MTTPSPVHAAITAYRAASDRAKALEDPDDETLGTLVDAELEAAQALIDAPCADGAEFIPKLETFFTVCEADLPPIGNEYAPLVLALAAYLEQRREA